jgi:hypothetical protein
MREAAKAFMRDAQCWPGSLEAAVAHRLVGTTYWFTGDYRGAHRHLEQAVAVYDSERNRHFITPFGYDPTAVATLYLACVLWPLGEVDRATDLIEQGLSLALQGEHIPTMVLAHIIRCSFFAICHQPDRAAPEISLGLAREHGLPLFTPVSAFFLEWVRGAGGDSERLTGMRQAMTAYHDTGARLFEPLNGTLLAEAEAEAGHTEVGLATLDAQLAAVELSGQRWYEAEMHRVRGDLLLKGHPPDATAAEVAFGRAIEIARSQETRMFELRAALSLATLYQVTGRGEAARELLAPVVAGFTEGPELPELAQANRLLADLAKQRDSTEATNVASQTRP